MSTTAPGTGPSSASPSPSPITSPSPSPSPGTPRAPAAGPGRGQRARTAVLVVGLVLALGVVLALLTPRTTRTDLAPDSVAPGGARAVAQVLGEQGVVVETARSFDAATSALARAGASTLLITRPDLLSPQRLAALARTGADVVLLAPTDNTLETLAPGVHAADEAAGGERAPGCRASGPAAAGEARAGGQTYALTGTAATGGSSCYGGSYVELPARAGTGRVVVLGQSDVITNRYAARDGNAALALHSLGARPTLVWYLPDPLDTDEATVPLSALVPGWLLPGTALLVLAGLATALWRGRRLGRLVPEPLPVVVRAAETVEGHGRLYAGAGAAGRAADVLRAATLRRLRVLTRLDAAAPVSDVTDQVAWITGRHRTGVRELLAGGPPGDDAALVRLARDLDALEHEVTHRGG